jgi:hypothetical protein
MYTQYFSSSRLGRGSSVIVAKADGETTYLLNISGRLSNMSKYTSRRMLSMIEARKELRKYLDRYHTGRQHQGLDNRKLDEVYYNTLPKAKDATRTGAGLSPETSSLLSIRI